MIDPLFPEMPAVIESFQKIEFDTDRRAYQVFIKTDPLPMELVSQIPPVVTHCKRICSGNALDEREKSQIRDLFFRKIKDLVIKNQTGLSLSSLIARHDPLQRALSPELDACFKEEKQGGSCQLKAALAKVQLASSFGVKGESCGGKNGARICKSLEKKPLAVFKRPNFGYDLKKVVGQARLLDSNPVNRVIAEVAAFDLDRALGFHVAPPATMATIEGDEGAFILYLEGYQPLKNIAPVFNREEFASTELSAFQRACTFDFLTGNMDCHDENLFIKVSKENKIEEVKVIDFGNAFIIDNPGEWGLKGNQYAWGSLKIAKKEFTEEVLEFLKTLSEEKLAPFLEEYRKKKFISEEKEKLLKERFLLVTKQVAGGEIKTPAQLSQFHTNDDFKNSYQRKENDNTNK